jgi:hypothetical protein
VPAKGYPVNPFFDPYLPPIGEPDSFRAFLFLPRFDRFWRVKLRSWMDQGIRISTQEFVSLWIEQRGNCGICELNYTVTHRLLAVDHEHSTGIVRGLLDFRCNDSLARREFLMACGTVSDYSREQKGYLYRWKKRMAEGVGLVSPLA